MASGKDDLTSHKRERRSIRLREYDYSQAGKYRITICTRNRECLFGTVVDRQMLLNEMGQIVQKIWADLTRSYKNIELDVFAIMPNHMHGIVVIHPEVGAIHESPLQSKPDATTRVADRRHMLLWNVIGRFKMLSAKQVNDLRESRRSALWQRNYHEHIVRDEESLKRIRQYITDNPAQWEFDRENPAVRRDDS